MQRVQFPCIASLLVMLVSPFGGAARGGEASFEARPVAVKDGAGARISFAVSAPTDAEVTVLGADGKPVRHLGAGLLGPNAPAPFQKNSLKQEVPWDGKDDDGQPVAGPSSVRVRLGLGAQLDRLIGRPQGHVGLVTGLGVGTNGEVYVLSNWGHASAYLYVLDREGRYLRTLLPSPAGLTNEQLKGLERIKLNDGRVVPIVYQANAAHLAPFQSGIRDQQLHVTPQGWIVFASGGSDYSDQSVPRHVLAIKPDGSTPPEVGFVGPPLGPYGRYSIGLRPQQVVVSPDGKTIYMVGLGQDGGKKSAAKGIHAVGMTTWDAREFPQPFIGKPDEPGADGEHLNAPVSLATDPKGNLYVADNGNDRVAVFDAAGKFLGETRVKKPWQVAVHPGTGALYVLTQPDLVKAKWGPFAVIRFDKAVGGTETSRLDYSGRGAVMALDATAAPPKVWLSYDPGWQKARPLLPLTDTDGKLAAGESAFKDVGRSFNSPLFVACDPGRSRLYVGDLSKKVVTVDLKTDTVSDFKNVSEAAVDSKGNVYCYTGYGANTIERFDPDGKPLPFPATNTHKLEIKYRAGLPNVGVRGLCVAPDGDVYAYEDNLGAAMRLRIFGPDGKLKKEDLVGGIPGDSAQGVAVDRAGNIYAGINVHDAKRLYPAVFEGVVPAMAWERTYRKDSGWYAFPQRGVPPSPWDRMYLNYYLYHYGNVFKFPPEGGQFWSGGKPAADGNPRPAEVPADAAEYRTGLLGKVVWVKGAQWRYDSFALCSNRTENSGDPTCSCWTGRFALDESGRLFVPDVFRFSVGVLDSNGNEILRFGDYGNMDDARRAASGAPAIPLAWPHAVAVGDGKAYVLDRIGRHITAVKLTFASEEICEVK